MSQKYSIDMTTGALLPKILAFSFPLMLTGLLQIVYNAADIMVVGKFAGSTYLAAVGATSNLINLCLNMFLGLSVGAGVLVAKNIGSNDVQAVHRASHTTILLAGIIGVVLGIVCIIFSPSFLRLMGTPDNIIELSILYLRIFFISAPAITLYNFGAAVLRSTGDSKRPLYILAVTGLLNVLLNLLLVIVFKLNVAGVAIATVIAQYVSVILLFRILFTINSPINISVKHLRIYKAELLEILRIGLPAGLQSALFSISNVVIQSSINSFGSVAIAGNTSSANIDNLIFICCNAISQAATTFTSQNVGANKYRRINKIYFTCLASSVIFSFALSGILYYFRYPLLGLFTNDSAVVESAIIRLRIFALTIWINSMLDITTGQMRGLGKSVSPMVITMAGVCGLRLLWIFTYFRTHHSLAVVYFSYPLSWVITDAVIMVMYFFTQHKFIKEAKLKEAETEENI